jgi:hypothetical protein
MFLQYSKKRGETMSITIELEPIIEQKLRAQAHANGVSLADYVHQIVTRKAQASRSSGHTDEASNLAELFAQSPFRGLNIEFERDRDFEREMRL